MKRSVFLGLLATATWQIPTTIQAAEADLADVIGRKVDALMDEHDIPGIAVGVTVDGREYFFNYGVASLETRAPVTEHTLFETGSVSKIFTAILGGYAAARGKLSLSDHPSQFLPELAGTALDRATLLNLATYTAGGLPLQFPDHVATDAEAPAFFAQWEAEAAPGEFRRYSNPSIGLFGYLTARAMGGDYADLIENMLLGALGLEESYIDVPEEALDDYAWGYDGQNRPIRVNPGVFDAEAYGVKSSAVDLIKLVEANLRPERLDETVRESIAATHVGYFKIGEMVQGLGWEQFPYPLGLERLLAGNSRSMAMDANPAEELTPPVVPTEPTLFSKTGSTNGFGAYVGFVPAENIGLVMLANKNYLIPARITAGHAILEELRRIARNSVPVSADNIR